MVKNKGFTMIEMVIVVAIMALLLAVITSPFQSFRNSKALDTTSEEALSLFSEARGNTLSAKDGYQYGVHLESSKMVLFRGGTYSSLDTNNKTVVLDNALEISSIVLEGAGSDIVFDKLTGKTSQSGSFVIRVKSDTSKIRTITVVGTGVAVGS